MRTRIISAAAAIAVLGTVIYLGKVAIGLGVFVLAAVGIYEFYSAMGKGGFKPVGIVGYLCCLPLLVLPFVDLDTSPADSFNPLGLLPVIFLMIFLVLVLLFCISIFTGGRYNLADLAVTVMGVFYVVFLISFVTLTRNLDKGYIYIWIIIIGACATDTFAYFTGVSIGRTKIIPVISPKKSLEGSIGGIVGCVAAMAVFGLLEGKYADMALYHFVVLGLICGVISQFGDWAASAVKRYVNIKDYGNIMPGHGGVLDRVDSVLFVAPAVFFYISLVIK